MLYILPFHFVKHDMKMRLMGALGLVGVALAYGWRVL